MKTHIKLLAASAIALAPISTHAGGLAPAIEEAPIVIEEVAPSATSSLPNIVVPLILLGLVGLAATSGSGGSGGAKDIITEQ